MCTYHNRCGHLDLSAYQSKPEQQHARIVEREEEESDMEEDLETEVDDTDEETRKKSRVSRPVKRVREEMACVLDDPRKSVWEKREWMRRKVLELEERKVGCEWEVVEMEKQRVKWIRYQSKKEREREMEKAKLENQRRRLETERMVLILRRREIEMKGL